MIVNLGMSSQGNLADKRGCGTEVAALPKKKQKVEGADDDKQCPAGQCFFDVR